MENSDGTSKKPKQKKPRPAINPELREQQLIAAAVNLAEQQILDGTASSQVITHFLKLGSSRNKEEIEKLRRENDMLKAKAEALRSQARYNELVEKAIAAFKRYSGYDGADEEDDDEYEY